MRRTALFVAAVVATAAVLVAAAGLASAEAEADGHEQVAGFDGSENTALVEVSSKAGWWPWWLWWFLARLRYLGPGSRVCTSSGDTHVTPFGGQFRFDIYNDKVPFVLSHRITRNPNQAFTVQCKQRLGVWGPRSTINDVAVRCGRDLAVFTNPRNGAPVSVKMNGRDITRSITTTPKGLLPTAPKTTNVWRQPSYNIYQRHDNWYYRYYLDCNRRGNSYSPYSSGFLVTMTWRRNVPAAHIHGMVQIEADYSHFMKMEGACGWLQGNFPAAWRNHLISLPSSLFAITAKDHAAAAARGEIKVTDEKHLRKQEDKCVQMIKDGTGVDVRNLHARFKALGDDVDKEVKNFVDSCAIDMYYGGGYDARDMKEQVCSWVDMAIDAVQEDIDKKIEEIKKCEQSPQSAAEMLEERWDLQQFCTTKPPAKPGPLNIPPCKDCKSDVKDAQTDWTEEKASNGQLAAKIQTLMEEMSSMNSRKAGIRGKIWQLVKQYMRLMTVFRSASAGNAAATREVAQKIQEVQGTLSFIAWAQQRIGTIKTNVFLEELTRQLASSQVVRDGAAVSHKALLEAHANAAAAAAAKDGDAAAPATNKDALTSLFRRLQAELNTYLKELTAERTRLQNEIRRLAKDFTRDISALIAQFHPLIREYREVSNKIVSINDTLKAKRQDKIDSDELLPKLERDYRALHKECEDYERKRHAAIHKNLAKK